MKKINPVVHFELPAENRTRMVNFYTSVFGWEAKVLGEDFNNYVTVATSESDENGRPKIPGSINGGFYLKGDGSAAYPSVVIAVDDINTAIKKVKEANGKVLGDPSNIPGVGLYVSFSDTEGNILSILQPQMK